EQPHIVLEDARERLGCLLTLRLVLVEQAIEGRLDAELLAVDVEAKRGHGLAEQPVPRAAPRDGLLMEQLLYSVLELIGLFLAHILTPAPVVPELRVGHGRLEQIVVEPVELEREEQELGGDGGDLLLY